VFGRLRIGLLVAPSSQKQPSVWSAEFYEDMGGRHLVKSWMDSLSEEKYAALDAAITYVLEVKGLDLASTVWLTSLRGGLYEFRVRHTAEGILRLYAGAGEEVPKRTSKILLRLFVHFHGSKIILLLAGYDKGANNSSRHQQAQIAAVRKLLTAWQRRQTG
jgi:hypothetical protein